MDDITGAKKLCAAILERAYSDIVRDKCSVEDRRSAAFFIDHNNRAFQVYAYAAGFDPEWLAKKMWQRIFKEKGLDKTNSPYTNAIKLSQHMKLINTDKNSRRS